MSWPIVAVVVVAVIAAVLAGLRFMGRAAAPDVRVLSQLRQAGSDLRKPHPIEFYLCFRPRKHATESSQSCRLKATLWSRPRRLRARIIGRSLRQSPWSPKWHNCYTIGLNWMRSLRQNAENMMAGEHPLSNDRAPDPALNADVPYADLRPRNGPRLACFVRLRSMRADRVFRLTFALAPVTLAVSRCDDSRSACTIASRH